MHDGRSSSGTHMLPIRKREHVPARRKEMNTSNHNQIGCSSRLSHDLNTNKLVAIRRSNLGNTTDVPSLDRESHWLVSKGANLAEQRSNNVTCVGFARIAVAVLHQDRAEDTRHFHVVGATCDVFLEAA